MLIVRTNAQLRSTLELSKPSSPFIQKAIPQQFHKQPTNRSHLRTLRKRYHLNTEQQLDLHYFGPAAHIRAEQLAAEATVQSNDDGIEYGVQWTTTRHEPRQLVKFWSLIKKSAFRAAPWLRTCLPPDEQKQVTIEQEGQ